MGPISRRRVSRHFHWLHEHEKYERKSFQPISKPASWGRCSPPLVYRHLSDVWVRLRRSNAVMFSIDGQVRLQTDNFRLFLYPQTTNFGLHNERTDNRIKNITWTFSFQFVFLHVTSEFPNIFNLSLHDSILKCPHVSKLPCTRRPCPCFHVLVHVQYCIFHVYVYTHKYILIY